MTEKGAWSWHPVRVGGCNRIAVRRGGRLVALLGPHEADDAHALCQLRNLAAEARVRMLGEAEKAEHGGQKG